MSCYIEVLTKKDGTPLNVRDMVSLEDTDTFLFNLANVIESWESKVKTGMNIPVNGRSDNARILWDGKENFILRSSTLDEARLIDVVDAVRWLLINGYEPDNIDDRLGDTLDDVLEHHTL